MNKTKPHISKHTFTVLCDRRVDEKIYDDLRVIRSTLLDAISGIEAIVLTGGFGRGEGSVVVDNEKIQPINDYDIAIIVKGRVESDNLERLRDELSVSVGIRQVDIAVFRQCDLCNLKFSMLNYDLKYGSYVFHGDPAVLNQIREMDAGKMPLCEGRATLLLYLISLLQAFPGFDRSKKLTKEQRFWSYQQITKSILGWSTSLLILKGLYHHSYLKRENYFKQTYGDKETWCKLVSKACAFKLSPHINVPDDLYEFWNLAKEEHMKVLFYFFCKFYKKKFSDWPQVVTRYKLDFKNIARVLCALLLNQKHHRTRVLLTACEVYLCAAISCDSVDQRLLSKASVEMNKIDGTRTDAEWDVLRNKVIELEPNCRIFRKTGDRIFYEAKTNRNCDE